MWLIDANSGFNPSTLTYDNTHPNAAGEVYVGDRMSGGLGLIEMPEPAGATSTPPVIEKGTGSLTTPFQGNEIYDGSQYINGWTEVTPSHTSETLTGTDLNRTQTGAGGAWIEGTSSTQDGGATTWSSGNDGDWTWEARLRINASTNGMMVWLGTGNNVIYLTLYNDRTENYGGGSFSVSHTNNDGSYHVWRVAHDSGNTKYHVWRDAQTNLEEYTADTDPNESRSRLRIESIEETSTENEFEITVPDTSPQRISLLAQSVTSLRRGIASA